jgi:hypothetical protein
MTNEQPPEGITPEGLPEVPNIDEHPSFNEAPENDPLMQGEVPGPSPTGNREDGPLTPEQKAMNGISGGDEVAAAEPEGPQPAIGIHVVFMEDGQFGIQATGEPNLGEMQMLLSRALKSVESRMIGETVAQVMKQNKSRIITPGR